MEGIVLVAATLSNFVSETVLSTNIAALISSSGKEKKFIGKATFTNTGSAVVAVTVWRLASTTTPIDSSGGNWLVKRFIQPQKVWECDNIELHVVAESMSLFATADTANVVNVDISGVTET
jgi:hypothetical protein